MFALQDITGGQQNALVKNLMKATGINDPVEAVRSFNNNEWALSRVAKAIMSLAQYFVSRKGLYVYDSFAKRVLPFAKESDTADISKCDAVNLTRNMSDTEIIDEYLGGMEELKKNVFTLSQLCTFLDNQWNGNEGVLLTNGYVNVFYCLGEGGALFAVSANRLDGEWHVLDWHLVGHGSWSAGYRIFRNKP
jgi:hypothetical protein